MRVAFVMRNVGYFRNFEWVIRALAERGHFVRVCFDRVKVDENLKQSTADLAAQEQLDQVMRDHPKMVKPRQFPKAHLKPLTLTAVAGRRLQHIRDYLRYTAPEFADSESLRERAARYLEPATQKRVAAIGRRAWSRALFARLVRLGLWLVPPRDYIKDIVRKEKADVFMVTPLLGFGEGQLDYFKAASELGVRSALAVASWDNLTSKGMMHCTPGRVLVWNDAQKHEAMELHGIPARRVEVTGAHCYEHWFTWEPTSDKATFCRRVGLDPDRDYVVFLCSSAFIAADELPVIKRWARALRDSPDPKVAEIGILIRPHPYNMAIWAGADLSDIGNVAVFPLGGANPVSREAKSDYFDTMYHCRAVVGVNTTAMIEASILGKPVHTVLFPETAVSQTGTIHFSHLADADDGLVRVAKDLDEHVAALSQSLADPAADERRSKAFVERFVCPPDVGTEGMVAAFVGALEAQAAAPAPILRRATMPLTWLARTICSPILLLFRAEYRPIAERQRLAARERERRKQMKAAQKPREG